MKDQEILGEDSIPGQGPESGSQGMVLSLALWLIRGYRYLISPMTQPSCRFFPSCSEYAQEALTNHGLLRGCWREQGFLSVILFIPEELTRFRNIRLLTV